MSAKASHHRLSNECGDLVVEVRPRGDRCPDGKEAVTIRVRKHKTRRWWAPDAPLCLSPAAPADTRKGRRHAAEDAAAFYEAYHCGQVQSLDGLDGLTKKHFQRIADILKTVDDAGVRCRLTTEFSRLAEGENPGFDRARFSKAAGCDGR